MKPLPLVKKAFLALLLGLTLRFLFIELYRVENSALEPNIPRASYLVISKSAYNLRLPFLNFQLVQWALPERGDLVAFFLPERGNQAFVSRVVALPGESFEIRDQHLLANGEGDLLSVATRGESPPFGPIKIPPEHVFLLNDDRSQLTDSRTFGPLPLACLKGKVFRVYSPK